jgi:hypothetical protein
MDGELKILNKYLKKMFPFIVEVDSIANRNKSYDRYNDTRCRINGNKNSLNIHIYVSPLHFCELMDDRVEKKLQSLMLKQSTALIKSIITDCNPDNIKFLFFPDVDKVTIFDNIPEE